MNIKECIYFTTIMFQKALLSAILISLTSVIIIPVQIKVSSNNLFLTTKEGKPFFWLGDTDWELFHRLNREVLEIRKQQGFNMIEAVVLAEMNGIREPNRYGDVPLLFSLVRRSGSSSN